MHANSALVAVDAEIRFRVVTDPGDHDDPISESLRNGKFPLGRLFDLLRRVVPPGGRVVDLGAHVGSFSLAAAAAGYEVVAVEASPRNAALLRQSIELNSFANIKLFNVAVSDKPGNLLFHSQGPYGHIAPEGYTGETVAVEAITVDELLNRAGWTSSSFMKLDIEGSEVAAIRGMEKTMQGPCPPVLFCESNGHMLDVFGQSPRTLKSALVALGCNVFLVEQDGLVQVEPSDLQGQTVVDYLAVRELPASLSYAKVAWKGPSEPLKHLRASATAATPERLYAARALRECCSEFGADPEAEAIRQILLNDADPAVRAVALTIPAVSAPGSGMASLSQKARNVIDALRRR